MVRDLQFGAVIAFSTMPEYRRGVVTYLLKDPADIRPVAKDRTFPACTHWQIRMMNLG